MTSSSGRPPRPATLADAAAAAALHADRIAEGFLVTLGPRFLRRLYERTIRSSAAFLLVTTDQDGVTGFVAVAEATGRLYREFLIRDGLAAGIAAAPAVLRAPKSVWETLRYGVTSEGDLPPAEILAVAVAAGAQRHGLGVALIEAAQAELRARGTEAARVVTSTGNGPAIRMYERAGFRREGRTEVHAGTPQEVLVWR